MADLEVALYVNQKEYNYNGYHAANVVKGCLQDAANHRSLSTDIDIVNDPQSINGQDGDCSSSAWDTWQTKVENGNIPKKKRSNLCITHRGYYDDLNGDGCAVVHGQAALSEGGKAFENVSSSSDIGRYDDYSNDTWVEHYFACVCLMEIGHNYGGLHNTSENKHHGEDYYNNGVNHWTPIVNGYDSLKGSSNVCGTDTLGSNDGADRYYGNCMADEIRDG